MMMRGRHRDRTAAVTATFLATMVLAEDGAASEVAALILSDVPGDVLAAPGAAASGHHTVDLTLATGGSLPDADSGPAGGGVSTTAFDSPRPGPVDRHWTREFAGPAGLPDFEAGDGLPAQAPTVLPFPGLDLDPALSLFAMGGVGDAPGVVPLDTGTADVPAARWYAAGGGAYTVQEGAWIVSGGAQAAWLAHDETAYAEDAEHDAAVRTAGTGVAMVSGRLAYAGSLSRLIPGLNGTFRPWAAADTGILLQRPTGPDDDAGLHPALTGRLRLGLTVRPATGPALSLSAGASRLGGAEPDLSARAGLRLHF